MAHRSILALALLATGCAHGDAGKDDTDPVVDGHSDTEPVDSEPVAQGSTLKVQTFVDGVQTDAPFVAVQDGDGAWTVATGGGGLYTVELEGTRYGVAVVCPGEGHVAGAVRHATTDEAPVQVMRCDVTAEVLSVSGYLDHLGSNIGRVAMATDENLVVYTHPWYGVGVPRGVHDLAAMMFESLHGAVVGVVLRRDSHPIGDVTIDLDMTTGAIVPVSHGLTVEGGADGETVLGTSRLHTNRGTTLTLSTYPDWYAAMPSDALFGHDVHEVVGSAASAYDGTYRAHAAWLTTATELTLDLPPLFDAPIVGAAATTPYVRPSFAVGRPAWADVVEARLDQDDGATRRRWTTSLSAGWLGGADVDYAFPDLSGVDGFDPAWGLVTGTQVSWKVSARSSSGGYALSGPVDDVNEELPPSPDLVGTTSDEVTRDGDFVP